MFGNKLSFLLLPRSSCRNLFTLLILLAISDQTAELCAFGSEETSKREGSAEITVAPPESGGAAANLALPVPEQPSPSEGTPTIKLTPELSVAADSKLSESVVLQSMEERIFNHSYSLDSRDDRLARLEKFVFGGCNGGELKTRIEKLNRVLSKNQQQVNPLAPAHMNAASAAAPRAKGLLDTINQGIDNYNLHRFHNAEDDFNEAISMAPGLSRTYVYLAVTLLQINQRQSAINALRAGYELDPFGSYGRYAKNCLITIMGDEEVRKRGPKDNLKTVQKTLEVVNDRAGRDSERLGSSGQGLASARITTANNFANNLNSDPENFSNENGMRQMYIRSDAMVQASRARQDAAQRAANTQESANNLKELITAKLLPGDAKLRAFGTNLNARYYGAETYNLAPWYIPREVPLALKAQSMTMKSLNAGNRSSKTEKTYSQRANSRTAAKVRRPLSRLQAKKQSVAKSGRK